MENSVKALLIAAGLLIGVLILSLGVSLYSSLFKYVESVHKDTSSSELQEFNEQFVKYINYDGNTKKFSLKIHDIVTAANVAYENNLNYGLTEQDGNNYYVTINIIGIQNNLEKTIHNDATTLLNEGLTDEYKCTLEDVKFNPNTGRVYQVDFRKN